MHRRRLIVFLTALLLASMIGGARAATTSPHGGLRLGTGVSRGYAQAAIRGVHYPWQKLDYQLILTRQDRPQRAITDNTARTITLYIRDGQPVALTSKVIAYEIGHVIDFWCGTLQTRRTWLHDRHATARTHWWAPDTQPEWAYGSGDYADVFSLWATGSTLGYVSTVAPAPTTTQLEGLNKHFTCAPTTTPEYAAP